MRKETVVSIGPEIRVERSQSLRRADLHNGLPPSLQRPFEKARENALQ
jgi:hypothetical protein